VGATSEIDSLVEPSRPIGAVALRAHGVAVDTRPIPATDRAQEAPPRAGDLGAGDDSVRGPAAHGKPAPGTTLRPRIATRRQDVPVNAIARSGSRRLAIPAAREPDVVHVHIGRVEVRASTAAREPDRRQPARPADRAPLSLEHYLDGERRR
jgi:hypothetical protein